MGLGLVLQEVQPKRILVAEDKPVNQRVARHRLSRMGYHADMVGNRREALAALAIKHYDIVLMDVQMPAMDGFEATARRREERPDPAPRPWIIAVTANAMAGNRARCLAAGMDDCVSKPLTSRELAEALARVRATKTGNYAAVGGGALGARAGSGGSTPGQLSARRRQRAAVRSATSARALASSAVRAARWWRAMVARSSRL